MSESIRIQKQNDHRLRQLIQTTGDLDGLGKIYEEHAISGGISTTEVTLTEMMKKLAQLPSVEAEWENGSTTECPKTGPVGPPNRARMAEFRGPG